MHSPAIPWPPTNPIPHCRNIVEAIGMMMEVVRQEPNLPDPYHLLGMLHEAVGNQKKALDFFMIAAHITAQVRLASRRVWLGGWEGLGLDMIACGG